MKTNGNDQNAKGTATAETPMSEEDRARKKMQAKIAGMAYEFERALPGKIGVERMMRIAMTAVLKTPTLALCDSLSFMGSLFRHCNLAWR
jgi:recombinational DNA repair protein RecT